MTVMDLVKTHNWNMPITCPSCGAPLVLNESGFPECMNKDCLAKVEHQLRRFFDILDIKIAGEAFVKNAAAELDKDKTATDHFNLFLYQVQNNNEDFFTLCAGGVNGLKILAQLAKFVKNDKVSKVERITAAQYFAMFDYPHLSVKQFEKLPELTVDSFFEFTYGELKGVDGIGDELATQILSFRDEFSSEIKRNAAFFSIKAIEYAKMSTLLTICFTGACPGYSRKELAAKCEGIYTVVNSVTKDLDFLACADPLSGSSKLQKAAKNGTKIISYDELLNNIQKGAQ